MKKKSEIIVEKLLEMISTDQMVKYLIAIPEDIWGGNGLDVDGAAQWLFKRVKSDFDDYEDIADSFVRKTGSMSGTDKDVINILKRLDVYRNHAAGRGTAPDWGTLPGGQRVRGAA